MIPRDKLGEDPLAWKDITVTFVRLARDSEDSCPRSREEIIAYVRTESADLDAAEETRLNFVRTAQVSDAEYWLWSYEEKDGELCYVALRKKTNSEYLSLSSASGLSPELYLLAHYYDMVYWS